MKKFCRRCQDSFAIDSRHWVKEKDGRYTTGYRYRRRVAKNESSRRNRERILQDPIRKQKTREYQRTYHANNIWIGRYKAYQHNDKVKGRETITRREAKQLMHLPCYYCGLNPCLGLDRINNSCGHDASNVVPCCEQCNNLLCDIPFEAKKLLISGLVAIRQLGLLGDWVIPTKRHRGES